MKKLELLKKVLLMVSVFALISGVSVISKATTGNVEDLLNDPNITNVEHINTAPDQSTTNTTQNTAPTNTPANNAGSANIAAVQNNTTNTTPTLPKTGVSDTAMWLLLAACVIAAIYTYKKVRDYNI